MLRDKKIPTIDEISSSLHRERLRHTKGRPLLRCLVFLAIRLTYVLMRLGVQARMVTILWLVLLFVAYGVMLLGTSWAFVIASLLTYFFLMLDWSDGEIGRFDKQFMTHEEDIRTFINGLYLDRLAHGVTSPLWGIALGIGLYRCTSDPYVLAAGLALASFWGLRQVAGRVTAHLEERFRETIKEAVEQGGFQEFRKTAIPKDSLIVRILDLLDWRLGGVLSANLIILVASLIDLGMLISNGDTTCAVLYGVFLIMGCASLPLTLHLLIHPVRKNLVLRGMVRRFAPSGDSTE